MPKNKINKNLVALSALFALTTVSYVNFSTFAPKALAEIREVRGITTANENKIAIPFPVGAQVISDATTSNTRQITLKTKQSSKKSQEFYNTVLTSKGWKIETEQKGDVFEDVKYKKNKDFIIVSTSKQTQNSNYTIVSIEVQQN